MTVEETDALVYSWAVVVTEMRWPNVQMIWLSILEEYEYLHSEAPDIESVR